MLEDASTDDATTDLGTILGRDGASEARDADARDVPSDASTDVVDAPSWEEASDTDDSSIEADAASTRDGDASWTPDADASAMSDSSLDATDDGPCSPGATRCVTG